MYNKIMETFDNFYHEMDINKHEIEDEIFFVFKSTIEFNYRSKDYGFTYFSTVIYDGNYFKDWINSNIETAKASHIEKLFNDLMSDGKENKETVSKEKPKEKIKEKLKQKPKENYSQETLDNISLSKKENKVERSDKKLDDDENLEDYNMTDDDWDKWTNKSILIFSSYIEDLKQIKNQLSINDDQLIKYAKEYDNSIEEKGDIVPRNIADIVDYINNKYINKAS